MAAVSVCKRLQERAELLKHTPRVHCGKMDGQTKLVHLFSLSQSTDLSEFCISQWCGFSFGQGIFTHDLSDVYGCVFSFASFRFSCCRLSLKHKPCYTSSCITDTRCLCKQQYTFGPVGFNDPGRLLAPA